MLRALDQRGFVFYTNYHSRKAMELEENPRGSLAFNWPSCKKQVTAEGTVRRIEAAESDVFFQTRPREAKLEAWAFPQSKVIPGRQWLERLWQENEAKFPDGIPRPGWWGGYRLQPDLIEFWQQDPYRIHDRLRYRKSDDGTWELDRLAP
jgi:pyridoxamine 5'-phosphate oxidase